MNSLQPILVPKDSSKLISVFIKEDFPDDISVFFGLVLLEKINNGKDSLQLKLLIARLYNMGYSRKELEIAFNFSRKTMQRWANALKSGNIEEINRVLAGNSLRIKLIPEVEQFVRLRFQNIYPNNSYTYSSEIRAEVEKCFRITLSSELLRPIFNQEKELLLLPQKEPEGEAICDLEAMSPSVVENNRKQIPSPIPESKIKFSFHLGLYLLIDSILEVTAGIEQMKIVRQWLSTVLLGAVNIEQSRTLNFPDLKSVLNQQVIATPRHQRAALKSCATNQNQAELMQQNAVLCEADKQKWFYYDPHSIVYNGMRKLLKGWCGGHGKIARAYYQDFIHTAKGDPVFFDHYDNYYDLRERFIPTVDAFSKILPDPSKPLTFVIDRGIYGKKILEEIASGRHRVITWEKGYNRDGWQEETKSGQFRLTRYRNNFYDLRCYDFKYIRYKSDKIANYDRIIVRASGTGKENVEVSILSNDSELSTEETIKAMFTRWLQENDFQYQIKHFGLNQITSYGYENYVDIEDELIDKEVVTNEFRLITKQRNNLKSQLAKLMVKREKITDAGKKVGSVMVESISQVKLDIIEIENQMSSLQRKSSKLKKLSKAGAQRLETKPKAYMDAVKMTARNIFYKSFRKFRTRMNNFRKDHLIFRELTRSSGFIKEDINGIKTITLNLAMTFQPKEIQVIEEYLQSHFQDIRIIGKNGSLEKEGILLAIVS